MYYWPHHSLTAFLLLQLETLGLVFTSVAALKSASLTTRPQAPLPLPLCICSIWISVVFKLLILINASIQSCQKSSESFDFFMNHPNIFFVIVFILLGSIISQLSVCNIFILNTCHNFWHQTIKKYKNFVVYFYFF